MIEICALASGSNGNCYYVGNETEAVIIDIGISNLQLKKRLLQAELSLAKVKAVFISHEHTDHIKGMRVTTQKNDIKGYATRKTYQKARLDYRSDKINYFEPGDSIRIGSILVHSFLKPHDAIEPVSFRVELNYKSIGVLTDIGEVNADVMEQIKLCDALFLESNYEQDILDNGPYPYFLKQRVSSAYGHLSNDQAIKLVSDLDNSPLKSILLSHISADNNDIDLLINKFKIFKKTHNIYPTYRTGISDVVCV